MADMYKRIDELLTERGISGAKMSSDLGMSRSFMTELRKGRAKSVKLETAQKIADYFGVSVHYLTGEEEQKNNAPDELVLTEDEIRILSAFREMSPERQKALADLLGISDS